jgi:hypothetical protein
VCPLTLPSRLRHFFFPRLFSVLGACDTHSIRPTVDDALRYDGQPAESQEDRGEPLAGLVFDASRLLRPFTLRRITRGTDGKGRI